MAFAPYASNGPNGSNKQSVRAMSRWSCIAKPLPGKPSLHLAVLIPADSVAKLNSGISTLYVGEKV